MVLLTAVAGVACHSAPRVPGAPFVAPSVLAPLSDAEEAHDELLRADLARADSVARLGFASGLATTFASDIVYLRGGLPIVRGRDAVRAIVAAESLGTRTAIRWQPVRAEASADGRSGYSYGYAIYSAADGGATVPSIHLDRYIAFWRRDDAGWKIAGYAETYGRPPSPLSLPPAAENAVVPDEPMPATRGALEAIRSADSEFSSTAARIGTGKAFGVFAAPDAQVFSTPGEFITGPAAISEAFGPSGQGVLAWHPVAGEASHSGDLGFTVGNAVFTGQRDDGTPTVRYSKYLTVWKRQADGRWRYVVDGGSARPQG